jgi:hypothetical protein
MSGMFPTHVTVSKVFKKGSLVVTDTALGFGDAAGVTEEDLAFANEVTVTLDGGDIRFWRTGEDPETGEGLLWREAWGPATFYGAENIQNMRLIRDGEANTVQVCFELGKVE